MISTKRTTRVFDAPIRVYPAAAVILSRRGDKPLIFRPLRREYGLLEIYARRCYALSTRKVKLWASSLVMVRSNR